MGRATIVGATITIPCYGLGHGIGMSQEGIRWIAERAEATGKTNPLLYQKEAKLYFPGAEIVNFSKSLLPSQNEDN